MNYSPVPLILLLGVLLPSAVRAQDPCPEGRVLSLAVESRGLFEESVLEGEGRFRWVYRLGEALHVRTREDFIARALRVEPGDCLDRGGLEDALRELRSYRFISRADLAVEDSVGGAHLQLAVSNEWTTKPALVIRIEDRLRIEGGAIFEENLLGRGITFGVYALTRQERRDLGASLEIPRVAGSNWDAAFAANRTRVGGRLHQALIRPFDPEQPGYAWRESVTYERDLFSYVLPAGGEYTHLVLPVALERIELSGARRLGRRGRLWLFGAGLTLERLDFPEGSAVELVNSGDFAARTEAGDEFTSSLRPQLRAREGMRLYLLGGGRRLRFETRRGLDLVDGEQDVPRGQEVQFSLGRSLGGQRGLDGDLSARVDLLLAGARAGWVGQLHLAAEGRSEDEERAGGERWSDLLLEGHAFLYLIPRRMGPVSTVLLRGSFQGGWHTTAPHQLTLGGEDAVRGYSERSLPVGARAIGSLELRTSVPNPLREAVDLGSTIFMDVGKGWKVDTPFSLNSGWRATVGMGLRIGFPAGSSSVIRADIAVPVGGGSGGSRPIFRVAAGERIGILGGFRSTQLDRSRRTGIRGEFGGVAR